MRTPLLVLLLTIGLALVGVSGTAGVMTGLVQVAFFLLLVVFVVLMVMHVARDRL